MGTDVPLREGRVMFIFLVLVSIFMRVLNLVTSHIYIHMSCLFKVVGRA